MNKPPTILTAFLLFTLCLLGGGQLIGEDSKAEPKNKKTEITPESIRKSIQQKLLIQFDKFLKDPRKYQKRVKDKCHEFPEGDLFPYIYPAMAYVNLALQDPQQQEHCVQQAQKLIDLAIVSVSKRTKPKGNLENLIDYKHHATYLGQLNLALGAYYLISDDKRYEKLHKHLSDILHQALVKAQGRPLQSFPEYSWPFDTLPVLVSLKLYDLKTEKNRSQEVITQHLLWVQKHATDPRLGLPYSKVDNLTGKSQEMPRGCDLSFRFCLLPHIDAVYAKKLYRQYTRHYWLDLGHLAGFAEWPEGKEHFMDVDSGPIVKGIGLGATGLGLGAVQAMNDEPRKQKLYFELISIEIIRPLFFLAQKQAAAKKPETMGMITLDEKYFTGFLFGDAMLFYCMSWEPWNKLQIPNKIQIQENK